MNPLVGKEFWILPKPKYIDINSKESGITLSSLLTIYVNKYRIKDNALILSSKFNKHLNTFLNAIPIRDSSVDEKWGENYYFSIITSESQYDSEIERNLNEMIETRVQRFREILKNCCYDIYPEKLDSNIPLDESYFIEISNRAIWIISKTPRGFYYGIQTIVQVIEHTLFQLSNLEGFIILPKFTIVDFPDLKFRGISVNISQKNGTEEFLTRLVSFLGKYKLNIIKIQQPWELYKDKSFLDLCRFHWVTPIFSDEQNSKISEKLLPVPLQKNVRYDMPDYIKTVQKLLEIKNTDGVYVSTPIDWKCPFDLLKMGVPLFSHTLWNLESKFHTNWKYIAQASQINLFEIKPYDEEVAFLKLLNFCSSNEDSSSITTLLENLETTVFENVNLLKALEDKLKQN